MWGNDPDLTYDPGGLPPGKMSQETWIKPQAPSFTRISLGWRGRLARPMDVTTRQNVLTPSGKRYIGSYALRASACMSCHGSGEFPLTVSIYPSPNKKFPPIVEPIYLYDPGSADWARWYQNRAGNVPISDNIGVSQQITIWR